jgi:Secretion system C-terminal sorting domain
MKKLIILFLVISQNCFPQAYPLKIFITDSSRIDSVLFGLRQNSTLGIDTLLGEKDIYNISPDSFDMRIIQRDALHYKCLTNTYNKKPIVSKYNIDSKIDYRPPTLGFDSITNNFEILIKSDYYPYRIIGNFIKIGNYHYGSQILLLDSTCKTIISTSPHYWESIQVIDTIKDSKKYYLIVHLEAEVGIKNIQNNSKWLLYPNPIDNYLIIKGINGSDFILKIYDIVGNEIFLQNISQNNEMKIETKYLKNGVYLLKVIDKNTNIINSQIFIKQ